MPGVAQRNEAGGLQTCPSRAKLEATDVHKVQAHTCKMLGFVFKSYHFGNKKAKGH